MFQCITVASRPLRVEELAEFLAFDFDDGDDPRFDADWRSEDAVHVLELNGGYQCRRHHISTIFALFDEGIPGFESDCKTLVSRYHIPLESVHLTMTRACLTFRSCFAWTTALTSP